MSSLASASLIDEIAALGERKLELLARDPRPKIGWVSVYTPEEILIAAGLVPFRITGSREAALTRAPVAMHPNVCSYVLGCLEEGLEGALEFSDGAVIVNACDSRRRLYDVWEHFVAPKFLEFLDLPKVVNEQTTRYFRDQLARLAGRLERHYGCDITADLLREATLLCNETRRLLARLAELRKQPRPAVTGAQAIRIATAATSGLRAEFNKKLAVLVDHLEREPSLPGGHGMRLMLCGSYFDQMEVIDVIEENGGTLVCEDTTTGYRYFQGEVDIETDPLDALARYYLGKAICARMYDFERRIGHRIALARAFDVDAVVYFALKFCDPNLMDYPLSLDRLTREGIPVFFLESERSLPHIQQLRTRFGAFMENLRDVR